MAVAYASGRPATRKARPAFLAGKSIVLIFFSTLVDNGSDIGIIGADVDE
jgi:hypothetical protein